MRTYNDFQSKRETLKMTSELFDNINKLTTEEVCERIKSGYYSDTSLETAAAVLKLRGLDAPAVDENYTRPSIPFYKSHPIWFWTFAGAGLTALGRLISKLGQ